MKSGTCRTLFCLAFLAASPIVFAESNEATLRRQVEAVERAFAKTMADRNHEAFTSFLSAEAVFMGGSMALRGKEAVAASWSAFFEGAEAPFSWEPATVEVLESGDLALSTGPVHNAAGDLVSTFTSIWRQEEPGTWRIVFDRDNQVCPQPEPAR